MWPSFAKTLGRRQGVDPPLPVRRPPPAQRSSRGAAQGPDRARQREPPDPRQGGRHLRDPVRGRAQPPVAFAAPSPPPPYVSPPRINTSFTSLRNGGIRTRRFTAPPS